MRQEYSVWLIIHSRQASFSLSYYPFGFNQKTLISAVVNSQSAGVNFANQLEIRISTDHFIHTTYLPAYAANFIYIYFNVLLPPDTKEARL